MTKKRLESGFSLLLPVGTPQSKTDNRQPKTDNQQPNSGNYISNKGIENIVEEAAKSDEGIKMLIDKSAINHDAGLIFSLLNKFGEDYINASDDKKYCM